MKGRAPSTKPVHRTTRKRRRTRTGVGAPMTYRQAQQALRQAHEATARRYQKLGRAPVASADQSLVGAPVIKTRLVRKVAAIIDADPTLVPWVTDLLAAGKGRGRRREFSVRTGLICYVLQCMVYKHFQLFHLPRTLETMDWRVRRSLGISYMRNGQPTQLSYNQLLGLFHDLADVFDAWGDDLGALDEEPEARAERAANLQEFVDRFLRASNHAAPMWSGNGALDATLKWGWERPQEIALNSKIERNGRDGDGGPPLPLSQIATDADGELDRDDFVDLAPAELVKKQAGRTKRPKNWPDTWGLGTSWVGRGNKSKGVHGIALHTMVRSDGPCLVESMSVTPANGDPVRAALPMLRRAFDYRSQDPAVLSAVAAGQAAILGDVVADPAYTTRDFMAKVKAMRASPFGRLHRQNQEGIRYDKAGVGKRVGEIVTFNGHPVCECMAHTPLAAIRYPKFPFTTKQLIDYQRELAKTAPFEWKPNGTTGPDGSRQYIAPHKGVKTDKLVGGCEHCIDETGAPRLGPDGRPRRRCCTVRTRRVPAEALVLDQGPRIGSPEWHAKWNPRNRVEGSYGILKNLGVIGYCRSYHQYVGLARETLIAVFAMVAYNFHMLNQWRARQDLAPEGPDDDFDPFGNLPSAQPTAIAPSVAPPAPVKRGPKGLPIFGSANAGSDEPAPA